MAVFAHGQLRLYLLALLDEGPRHGYEVIRALEERFNGLYSPSAGTVYPRLAKLEEEGLVERSDEGRKATYFITERGRAEVRARAVDLADLQQDLDHSVRELANEVRQRVHGSAANLREELREAAKQARATATPAGSTQDQEWPTGGSRSGPAFGELDAAVNAFRHDVREAVRRVQTDAATRKEVLDILHDTARRIRHVLDQR
jgi:DNA-binding PadR family transcriptional regulator